ncbi:hypothetical protein XI03_25775 [Bradyrhizobium sp. CCBAU 65884]|uniref:hypothetical protein n=1 Tax=Bradyrhizobium sp. CCBAU 65884 TaxID=722477 RepID=UPI00230509E6|nr:hypothetical protein [Bradyrhizobium sp. CCBAU 65884]MDA9477831.1 hypothetical protein [Bradyrhizobium sp. CCBAU 65884]
MPLKMPDENSAGDYTRSIKSLRLEHLEHLEAVTNKYVLEAKRILLLKGAPDDSPLAERERFMEFLGLTSWMLGKFEDTEDAVNKVTMYFAALMDLSDGTVHPILKPSPLKNAAPASTDVWRVRAALAVALDFLVRARVPLNEAAKRVAKTKGIKKLLKQGADPVKSIKNWRNDISSGKAKNPTAMFVWKTGLEEYEEARKSAGGDEEALREQAKQLANETIGIAEKDLRLLVSVGRRSA